ncbi:MAG TPA: SRPBCC family protein [Bryobacteraceae bacterium]|jgi:hypothetical protein
MDEVWACEHSLECAVSVDFAWRFWTNVNNWRLDSDVEAVELDGPFEAGSRGATISRSSGRIEWRIASLDRNREAVIEIPVQQATARFRWTFENLDARTRMTQRASLSGDGATELVAAMASMVEGNLPAGMQRLCEAMSEAARRVPGGA